MLNQVVLVGRIEKIEKGENDTKMSIKVQRGYKNLNGEYDTDIIPTILKGMIANNTLEYCKINDVVGIKGKLENRGNQLMVLATELTFLSSKSIENEE